MASQAFLYKWTHIPTGKWYIGSRTAKGCHPADGYICSSSTVKPMIIERRLDWERTILVVGESKYIQQLEFKFLTKLDAKNDNMSFNLNNCCPVVKLSPRINSAGELNPFYGKKHSTYSLDKIRIARSKQVLTSDRNAKISKTMQGHIVTAEIRLKISLTLKNYPKKTCDHCTCDFLPAHYGRFHGQKCKENNYV